MPFKILKYPRTPHLEGSRLQPGDEDLSQIPFSRLVGKTLEIEEKIDGANSGISFDEDGSLLLQSRGHYLRGGARERDYDLLKTWAEARRDKFYEVLGTRYVMYGEWMFVKHAVYYDALPHYFLEFDIFDREKQIFLDAPSRRELTSRLPVRSVPSLARGTFQSVKEILALLGPSNFIREGHIERLREYCEANGLDADERIAETDASTTMEGLYIKVEADGQVQERLKYVRASFAQRAAENAEPSSARWFQRAVVPNGLAISLDEIFSE